MFLQRAWRFREIGLLLVSMGSNEINHLVNSQQLTTDLLLITLTENNEK